jgi:preprotein translocase subunit SecG
MRSRAIGAGFNKKGNSPSTKSDLLVWIVAIVALAAVLFISFLSMQPPPFAIAEALNGTWYLEAAHPLRKNRIMEAVPSAEVVVALQKEHSTSANSVKPVFDLGETVMIGPYSFHLGSVVPMQTHVKQHHWEGSCARDGAAPEFCTLLFSGGRWLFTVIPRGGEENGASVWGVREKDANASVMARKMKFLVGLFLVIVVVKLGMNRLRPSAKSRDINEKLWQAEKLRQARLRMKKEI